MDHINLASSICLCLLPYIVGMAAVGAIATRAKFKYAVRLRENLTQGLYDGQKAGPRIYQLILLMGLAWGLLLGLMFVMVMVMLYYLEPALVLRVTTPSSLRTASIVVLVISIAATPALTFLFSRLLSRPK